MAFALWWVKWLYQHDAMFSELGHYIFSGVGIIFITPRLCTLDLGNDTLSTMFK